MKEDGLGTIFVKHLVMAIPWGVILLLVFVIAAIGIKQQIKEGIQYAAKTSISEAANLAFDSNMITPVKQNIKEGIEFAAKTAKKEIKALLNDPQFKQDLREALEDGNEKSQ